MCPEWGKKTGEGVCFKGTTGTCICDPSVAMKQKQRKSEHSRDLGSPRGPEQVSPVERQLT